MSLRLAFAIVASIGLAACDDDASQRMETEPGDIGFVVDSSSDPADSRGVTPSAAAPIDAGADARPPVEGALRAALDARVRGAAAELDSAQFSWFSGATVHVIRSVSVDRAGRAIVDLVDLRAVIPNASSSAGSEALIRELNATVFAVEGVHAVEYRMAGSCELLGEWLQYGECLSFDRAEVPAVEATR